MLLRKTLHWSPSFDISHPTAHVGTENEVLICTDAILGRIILASEQWREALNGDNLPKDFKAIGSWSIHDLLVGVSLSLSLSLFLSSLFSLSLSVSDSLSLSLIILQEISDRFPHLISEVPLPPVRHPLNESVLSPQPIISDFYQIVNRVVSEADNIVSHIAPNLSLKRVMEATWSPKVSGSNLVPVSFLIFFNAFLLGLYLKYRGKETKGIMSKL